MTLLSSSRAMLASLVRLLGALCTAVVVAGQMGRWSPAFDVLNAMLAPVLLALAVFFAFALRTREWFFAWLAFLGLALGSVQLARTYSRDPERVAQASPELRLLTISTWRANPDPQALRKVILAQAPDIVLLQETNGTSGPMVDALLPEFARIKSCGGPRCSLTILSRWPLRRIEVAGEPGKPLPDILLADVDAPFGQFRVLNVHLPRPGNIWTPRFLRDVGVVAREQSSRPLLVGGDFNLGSGTFGLDRLTQRGKLRRLDGFMPTYPAHKQWMPAIVAIDHVMVNAAWPHGQCERTASGRSDHFGIACRLQLPQSFGALGR